MRTFYQAGRSIARMKSATKLSYLAVLFSLSAGSAGCKEEAKPEVAAPKPTESAAPVVAKVPDGTVFTKKAPTVGSKREESADTHMTMDLTVDTGNGKPKSSAMEVKGVEKRLEEVLAVSGDAPTKLKVTFSEKTETMKEGDKERPKKSALAGKTYVVDATGAKLAVTDEKGKPAPSAEAKEVEKQYKTLGKPEPMLAAMPSTPLQPGDPVPALAKALEEEMTAKADGMVVSNTTVVFKEAKGDEGIFDVGFTLSKDEGPMSMKIDMKGPIKVSKATSSPTAMNLKGPLTVSAKSDPKGKMKMDGKGEMQMSLAVHEK